MMDKLDFEDDSEFNVARLNRYCKKPYSIVVSENGLPHGKVIEFYISTHGAGLCFRAEKEGYSSRIARFFTFKCQMDSIKDIVVKI